MINKKLLFLFTCISFLFLEQGYSQFLKGTNIPADTTYNQPRVHRQIKGHYPYAIPAKDSLPKGILSDRNVIYTTLKDTPYGDRDLHLDVFYPETKGKYPALILVHGGGWRAGDKSLQIPLAQLIANKGFVTVTVEYQLSLEAKYPAAIHNIKSAIRWVRANAQKFSVDPDRIAITGSSAGGQLAALIGMTNGVEKFEGNMGNDGFSSDIQAIIDVDGVINFLAPNSLNLDRKPNSPDIEWLGGSYIEKPEIWKEASPIYWANENSVPILFLNSNFPRFHAGQDELISMYQNWGKYTEVHRFNVQVHPFWLFHPWIDDVARHMVAFMRTQM